MRDHYPHGFVGRQFVCVIRAMMDTAAPAKAGARLRATGLTRRACEEGFLRSKSNGTRNLNGARPAASDSSLRFAFSTLVITLRLYLCAFRGLFHSRCRRLAHLP